jgi:hypothetical protein
VHPAPPVQPTPSPTQAPQRGGPVGQAAAANYPGPPQNPTPAPGWRPPVYVQPAPPRPLPAQDIPAIEAEEAGARTLTYGVGLIAGAILLVVMCLLCSRLLF